MSISIDGTITWLEATADGTRLVLLMADGSARVWDVRDRQDRHEERLRAFAERESVGDYIDSIVASTNSTDSLLPLIANEPAFSPLQRLVAADVLTERLHVMDREAAARFWLLFAGTTHGDELPAAADTAQMSPRVKEILVAKLSSFAWDRAKRPRLIDDLERPVTAARKAVELAPESVECLITLGAALYRAKAFREALEVLGRARSINGDGQYAEFGEEWFLPFEAMAQFAAGETTSAPAVLFELRALAEKGSGAEGRRIDADIRAAITEAIAILTASHENDPEAKADR